MDNSGIYSFDSAERKVLEGLPVPMAVYQFVNDKVMTILVSDGICSFEGMSREEVIDMFNNDMYRYVHPEDVMEISKAAYRYATKGGSYNVTYREKIGGCKNYRIIHATGEHVTKEDGTRLSYISYEDVTEAFDADAANAREESRYISNFFDNNMEAMAVVSQKDDKLFYFNKAICRLFPPVTTYDTGMTFDQFFFGDAKAQIRNIYTFADAGPKTINNPLTGNEIEVNIISSYWEDEAAYLIYFYEIKNENISQKLYNERRHKRIAFNKVIFSGDANNHDYTDPDYQAFWIWNMSDNGKIVRDDGHESIHRVLNDQVDYEYYRKFLLTIVVDDENRKILEDISLDNIITKYYEKKYHFTETITVNSNYGRVSLKCDFIIVESPDTGEIYLKVSEENATREQVLKTMIQSLIGERFEFIAYIDKKAGKYRMFDESTKNLGLFVTERESDETCNEICRHIGLNCCGEEELIKYLIKKNEKKNITTEVVEINPGCQYKSIQINMLDKESGQFFITSSDITELMKRERELQNQLREALDEAEKVGRDRDNFIARTSHDLRTPLSAVISFSNLGLEENGPSELMDYFEIIRSSGEFMLSMLNDIIDIEKLQTGNLELHPISVRQNDFIKEIMDVVSPRAQEKKIHLELDASIIIPDDRTIKVDKQRVKQIITNILSNAIKYTPENGNVCWMIKAINREDGSAAFENIIRDNGVGMSEEFQQHMFEAYSREYNILSSRETGTGLGLAIVKKLIDALGGNIEVKSTIGEGTTFTVIIPYELAEIEIAAADENANGYYKQMELDFSEKTVLVCDDNEINQQIIEKMLAKTGIKIMHEYNGRACIERLKMSKCDLILMDISMPIMNGVDATKEIRSMGYGVPIIALSANANELDVTQSLEAGMNAHLTKPIDPKKFYSTLASILLD